MLHKANTYIMENQKRINREFRPEIHFAPPCGWLNDPNGFSVYKGEYHLFYQHNPFEEQWDTMYWGHAKSKDLITWENLPVALAPDQQYDQAGCFSGTALEHQEMLFLLYTCVQEKDGDLVQQQAMAVSRDGISFKKYDENPIIRTSQLPEDISPKDFRDPKIWKYNEKFYCAAVAKDISINGRLLLYVSDDMIKWELAGDMLEPMPEYNEMLECPDICRIDGKDVIIMSVIQCPKKNYEYWNKQSVVYSVGTIDYKTGRFNNYAFREMDYGFDFYAPQTITSPDGRQILIAWMQAWEDEIPVQEKKHGWSGYMTIPRELCFKNGVLYQNPIREIEAYRKNMVEYNNIEIHSKAALPKVDGKCIDLEFEVDLTNADQFVINLFKSMEEKLSLAIDKKRSTITLDRVCCGNILKSKKFEKPSYRIAPIPLENNRITIRILVDVCGCEIFAGRGIVTMTANFYPENKDYGISFESDGTALITNLKKWDLRNTNTP